MIIKDANNFLSIVVKMLGALGYENVEEHSDKAYDITAVKDGKKVCFKCQYDIDAISEKKMKDFIEGTKGQKFDELVFVTNSSFISSAKKIGDAEGVMLWDRNTVDRMCIGIREDIKEDTYEVKTSKKGLVIGIAVVVILALAAAVYFYKFR